MMSALDYLFVVALRHVSVIVMGYNNTFVRKYLYSCPETISGARIAKSYNNCTLYKNEIFNQIIHQNAVALAS